MVNVTGPAGFPPEDVPLAEHALSASAPAASTPITTDDLRILPPVSVRALSRVLVGEGEPVDVDEVGRLAAAEREVHVVYPGHRGDVGGDGAPALPAAGVGDGEAADRCAGKGIQPHLDQSAHASGRAGGDPGTELVCRGGTEV